MSASLIASLLTTASLSPSASINTLGANLLVAVIGFVTTGSVSDNQSNSWHILTDRGSHPGIHIAYVFGPVNTSASHRFNFVDNFEFAIVYAFSGMVNGSGVFDVQNGNAGGLTAPFQPGSISPTQEDVIVTGCASDESPPGLGINLGFSTPLVNSNNAFEVGGASYLLSRSTAVNPTWTDSAGNDDWATAIAGFKVAPPVVASQFSPSIGDEYILGRGDF